MSGRYSVEAVFRAVDRITAPVSRIQNRVGQLTRSMRRGFDRVNRTMDQVAGGIRRGAVVAAAAIGSIGVAMFNVLGTGATFEQTMVNAATKFTVVVRKGTEAFKELEDAALKTGATTEFTATQAAQALDFLAMAGFSPKAAIFSLPGVVDLATVSAIGLGRATDIASDALGAYGLMTDDVGQLGINLARVNDVLATTSTSANTTIEQLFESMRKGAPLAALAGSDIETVSALIGSMASAGTKSEKAGTAVTNMFLNLSAPASKARKVLKALDVEVEVLSGKMKGNLRDIPDIIEDLNKGMRVRGVGGRQRLEILEAIFGREGLAGVGKVVANGADALRKYREQLRNSGGNSMEMASVMRDTVQGNLNALRSAIEAVKIEIFNLNKGALTDVIAKTTEWVRTMGPTAADSIGKFMLKIINNFDEIVESIKRVAIGLAIFYSLMLLLKSLALILTVVNLLLAANPITLVVLGVLALIAAVALVIYYFDELTAAFMNSGVGVDALLVTIGLLTGPIGILIAGAALIIKYWSPIKAFFSELWGTVVSIFDLAVKKIGEIGESPLLMNAWDSVKTYFKDLWSDIGLIFDDSIDRIMAVVNRLKDVAATVSKTASSVGGAISGFFGFGNDDAEEQGTVAQAVPQVISPQDRVARSIEEQRTTSSAEVTIRDESGRAEVTGGNLGRSIFLTPSGGF
jgi:TP901 family phage tail tape measure protein